LFRGILTQLQSTRFMKTFLLPVLGTTALIGLMMLTVSLGAAVMLLLAAGLGAMLLQDYSARPRLQLRRRIEARAHFPALMHATEAHRLAA
jgi:hypothetical protein